MHSSNDFLGDSRVGNRAIICVKSFFGPDAEPVSIKSLSARNATAPGSKTKYLDVLVVSLPMKSCVSSITTKSHAGLSSPQSSTNKSAHAGLLAAVYPTIVTSHSLAFSCSSSSSSSDSSSSDSSLSLPGTGSLGRSPGDVRTTPRIAPSVHLASSRDHCTRSFGGQITKTLGFFAAGCANSHMMHAMAEAVFPNPMSSAIMYLSA